MRARQGGDEAKRALADSALTALSPCSVHSWFSEPEDGRQMRVRLKADGRLVQILDDGSERALPPQTSRAVANTFETPPAFPDTQRDDAAYARAVRARTGLTQAEFAARINVPVETVRNWEQGKRAPRGPARALLKMVAIAPDLVFATLERAPA
jgi:putative transcriptional regulator